MDELRNDFPPRFATALDYDFPADAAGRVTLLATEEPSSRGLRALRADVVRLVRVLRAARTHPALLLESKGGWLYPDVVAAAVLGLLAPRRRPKAVLMGEMWEPDGGLAGWLERRLLRLADRAIDLYAVQSSEELSAFPRLWEVDPHKLRLNPHFYHFDDVEQLEAETTDGAFVFAGGDSLRSYDPLVEAARRVPQLPVKARTRLLDGRHDLPPNVQAGRVARARFFDEMRAAKAVVVALKPGLSRAAGQQTFLNAMFLGKPTIVADGFGVRDHITHGVDGWIADGSVEGYATALRWAADDANTAARARMGAAARATARRFHFDAHARRLVHLVAECLRADARADAGIPASPRARPARG